MLCGIVLGTAYRKPPRRIIRVNLEFKCKIAQSRGFKVVPGI